MHRPCAAGEPSTAIRATNAACGHSCRRERPAASAAGGRRHHLHPGAVGHELSAAWPAGAVPLYLAGGGKASIDAEDGRLATAPDAGGAVEHIVHDPWRPAPSAPGAGPTDRSAIDARPDVLTFTAAPREAPITLAGDVAARLFIVSDTPSFDLCCVLSRVTPAGQVFALAPGYCRVKPGDAAAPLTLAMGAVCATLQPGEALRLSLSGAAFPAYAVNSGTGADPTTTPLAAASIITLGVRHGASSPSSVMIPVVEAPS